mmetsp:Transcript_48300/g.134260  ORF Transcript_48300/g.134260 Transcript_48300/m.134260 type:complete len:291 (-) Transcript_48300:28-900(-)
MLQVVLCGTLHGIRVVLQVALHRRKARASAPVALVLATPFDLVCGPTEPPVAVAGIAVVGRRGARLAPNASLPAAPHHLVDRPSHHAVVVSSLAVKRRGCCLWDHKCRAGARRVLRQGCCCLLGRQDLDVNDHRLVGDGRTAEAEAPCRDGRPRRAPVAGPVPHVAHPTAIWPRSTGVIPDAPLLEAATRVVHLLDHCLELLHRLGPVLLTASMLALPADLRAGFPEGAQDPMTTTIGWTPFLLVLLLLMLLLLWLHLLPPVGGPDKEQRQQSAPPMQHPSALWHKGGWR